VPNFHHNRSEGSIFPDIWCAPFPSKQTWKLHFSQHPVCSIAIKTHLEVHCFCNAALLKGWFVESVGEMGQVRISAKNRFQKLLGLTRPDSRKKWISKSVPAEIGHIRTWPISTTTDFKIHLFQNRVEPAEPTGRNFIKKWKMLHYQAHLRWRFQVVLCLYQKCFCLFAILHDTPQSAIWQLNILRNLATVDNISCPHRYHNTLLLSCLDPKNSKLCTSFMLHRFCVSNLWNFVLILWTRLLWTIEMNNITAFLETNHTFRTDVNFKTRNWSLKIKI